MKTPTKLAMNPDWLRAQTDGQLLERKADFETLIADVRSSTLRQPGDPTIFPSVHFILEYLQRTGGLENALAFIDELNATKPREAYFPIKLNFLAQHDQAEELDRYIEKLNQQGVTTPWFLIFLLHYHLDQGQREQAETVLAKIIANHDGKGQTLKAITLATVFDIPFDRSEFVQKVAWGETFFSLQKNILAMDEADTLPVIHCINLDRADKRLARCNALYEGKAKFQRTPAIDGNILSGDLTSRFNINPRLPKSAIGCSLSHITTWERIAALDESEPPSLVVEDDGLPLLLNRGSYGIVQRLMEEQELDLLYLHDRGSPLFFALREFGPDWRPLALPFEKGLERFNRYGLQLPGGWGTDGYCLSVRGARKLLALLERDGFTNHIDWQTFLYSAADWMHPVMRTKQNVAFNYRNTCGRTAQREINTAILNFPLIAHLDFSQSTR